MAPRKKRVLETAAPGVTETGASASVSVNDPAIEQSTAPVVVEYAPVDAPVVAAVESPAQTHIVVRNHGHRRFEPLTRTVLAANADTQIPAADKAGIVSNIRQINFLAGYEVIEILEQ